jgi:C4-dicarboxylate-specific signal transduction histidine kinase
VRTPLPIRQGTEPERVRALVEEILARDEYANQAQQGSWIVDLLEWLGEFIDWQPTPAGVSLAMELARGSLIIVGIVALAWLLFLLARGLRSAAERPAEEDGAREVLVRRVAQLRAAALAAQQRGDRIEALRLYFFALVVGLGERGELRYREAWTPRELLARGALRPTLHAALAPLMADLDAHSFGRAPAGADDVRRYSELCTRLLGSDDPPGSTG